MEAGDAVRVLEVEVAALDRRFTELREADDKLHAKEQELLAKALELQSEQNKVSFNEANQVRAQIDRERGQLVNNATLDAKLLTLATRLDALDKTQTGYESRIWMMGVVITVLIMGLQVILHYVGK